MRIKTFDYSDDYKNRVGYLYLSFAESYGGEDMEAVWNRICSDKYFRQQKFTDVMCKVISLVLPVDGWADACHDVQEDRNHKGNFKYYFERNRDGEITMSIVFPI